MVCLVQDSDASGSVRSSLLTAQTAAWLRLFACGNPSALSVGFACVMIGEQPSVLGRLMAEPSALVVRDWELALDAVHLPNTTILYSGRNIASDIEKT